MKITSAHIDHIRVRCCAVIYDNPDAWADYKAAGLSETRFRWDVARKAGLIPYFCSTIYQYANDAHIDTVLRHVIPLD